MTTEQILKREFDLINADLEKKHIELGMKASGKWINSLENVSKGNIGRTIGEPYTEQLVNGRRNGKFPPIQAIREWIIDKGIVNSIKGDISVSSLAFLIARKIAREGTKYYQQGGTDLVSAVITDERIQKIINMVGAQEAINFSKKIENEILKIAV